MHIAFHDDGQFFDFTAVCIAEQVVERQLVARHRVGKLLLFLFGDQLYRKLLGFLVVGADAEFIAGSGDTGQPEAFHSSGGAGGADLFALAVDQRLNAAILRTAKYAVANLERAVANEQGGGRAHARLHLRFNDVAGGFFVLVGFQFEHFGFERDAFEQFVDAHAGFGTHGYAPDASAPVFHHHAVIIELLLEAVGVGGGQIHLVHRNDDADTGGLSVLDRLNRLGHHAVFSGDNQHGDIGQIGSAGAHGSKGCMAGRVEEGNFAVIHIHGVGTDVLGDSARFARNHFRFADAVEQRGFAVVDVTHKGDDRRADFKIFRTVFRFWGDRFADFFLSFRFRLRFLFFLQLNRKPVLFAQLFGDLDVDVLVD